MRDCGIVSRVGYGRADPAAFIPWIFCTGCGQPAVRMNRVNTLDEKGALHVIIWKACRPTRISTDLRKTSVDFNPSVGVST